MSGSQKTLANEDSVVIGDEGACDPVLADLTFPVVSVEVCETKVLDFAHAS